MAQPVNSVSSNKIKGVREDLENFIYDITPEDTPVFSMMARTTAAQYLHEWQTDALRTSAVNAHIEGDDTVSEARLATVRLGNYVQLFKNAVTVPDGDKNLDKAGRETEMAYQSIKIGKEQLLDIEKALMANQARVQGSDVAPRFLAGIPSWLVSNVTGIGAGGSNPTGDGTNARTDGTQGAFTQANFDLAMQQAWQRGGKPSKVILGPSQMTTAQGFVGNNNQNSIIEADQTKVIKFMSVYVTPWGKVEFIPARENRTRDVFIMQPNMWKIAMYRGTRTKELASLGDNSRRQVLTELTLVSCNEKASAAVVDVT